MADDNIDTPAGQSFSGRSLQGADFSGKDVRGTDFSGADLRGADFTAAIFGMSQLVAAVVLGLAIVLTVAAGSAIGWAVDDIRGQVYADEWDEAAGGASLVFTLVVFIGLIFWRGLDTAVKTIVVVYLVVLVGNIIANFFWEDIDWYQALRGTFLLAFLFLAILAGVFARLSGGAIGAWGVPLVAILGGLATGQTHGGISGVVVAICLVVISKRALRGDPRDRTLRFLAHRPLTRWVTRFTDADLSGANFTGTDASRCGVKGATLDGVIWDPELPLPLDLPDDAITAGR